ncbi:MAG: L,D-transpeptidase family protein [Chloroflexi bacterium]|nr:L,D-transpeptidase family protein [Chloroflexota bacterium]
MNRQLSRRGFLKLAGASLGLLAFGPVFPHPEEQEMGAIARVAIQEIDLYALPRDDSEIIGKRYRDQIVHIYEEVISPEGPAYNPLWYRVWGGYLHSAYLQKVQIRHNLALAGVPEVGQLCEVTVPFTVAYQYNQWDGWRPWEGMPLYYETTHWITAIEEGPDKQPWYQLTSEIDAHLKYMVPTAHLRPISDAEIAPLSPQVAPEDKRIEVSIGRQTLTAYENDQAVMTTRISSGIPSARRSPDELPTATPTGSFRIYSKMPNKHMGSVTGNPDALRNGGFSLPGVPWTCFFAMPGGYAFHGAYWHNNFGIQMSHGCVNMRPSEALWLFRWTTPVFETPIENQSDWERRGNGTRVEVR